jgi:hypothetical protein
MSLEEKAERSMKLLKDNDEEEAALLLRKE